MTAGQVLAITANFIAIIAGIIGLAVWVRHWLLKQVREPLERLTVSVNRAHVRIDEYLLEKSRADG